MLVTNKEDYRELLDVARVDFDSCNNNTLLNSEIFRYKHTEDGMNDSWIWIEVLMDEDNKIVIGESDDTDYHCIDEILEDDIKEHLYRLAEEGIKEYLKGDNIMNTESINFYSYNGFKSPELLAVGLMQLRDVLRVDSNYRGDVTEETLEEITEHLKSYESIKEMRRNEDNCINSVWIEPSYECFASFNKSVGLSATDYLEEWM